MLHKQTVIKQQEKQQHAFTVDVEDWYHGAGDCKIKVSAERRLHYGLESLLQLLAKYQIKGTFFWLGEAALDNPELVKKVAQAGHEIGCHGLFHDFIYNISPKKFKTDTKLSQEILADLIGKPIIAYRAPYFSITRKSFWALEILAELGFWYDSSIFPIKNWRYGIPDFAPQTQLIQTHAGLIYEIPVSVRQVLGQNIPVTGGAYFRIYPYSLTKSNFIAAERQHQSVIFYIHPWELDPDHPPISLQWKERLTHYVNIHSTKAKLEQLMKDFAFTSLSEILENQVSSRNQTYSTVAKFS